MAGLLWYRSGRSLSIRAGRIFAWYRSKDHIPRRLSHPDAGQRSSAVRDRGIYKAGLQSEVILLDSLPMDEYECDGFYSLRAKGSGLLFTLGMPLRVRCARADINSGNIDFTLAEEA